MSDKLTIFKGRLHTWSIHTHMKWEIYINKLMHYYIDIGMTTGMAVLTVMCIEY